MVETKFFEFLYKNSKNSFLTFLIHSPIILILWLMYKTLPANIPYYIYWMLAPPITVYLSIILAKYFNKLLPRFASIALGGR